MNRNRMVIGASMAALLSRANRDLSAVTNQPPPKRMKTGETPRQLLAAYDVYVDDVLQRGTCLEADTEAGFVVRYRVGSNGKLIRNGDSYLTERVEGVKVEFRPKQF